MQHVPEAKASDMAGTSKTFQIKRLAGKGKKEVALTMNQPKEGQSSKPELGMTGKPTVTHAMQRDFGRTHKGAK